jgi:metallo-beta-lactamase class B
MRLAALALATILAAAAQNPQIRRPFKSDPPIMCDSCPAWNVPLEPVRVFGSTYYVGTERLSSVLIASEKGHILLDGGLPQSAELIDRNIRRLGFRTEDVELIVNSHTHFDHAGGIHALQHASGARVAASASSARALTDGHPVDTDPQRGFTGTDFRPVSRVRVIEDGQTLRVGTLAITAHLTPGHTPGSTTWTWKSCEGARCLDIVYADSLNAVAAPGFRYSADPARVALFRKSIETVASLPCDIVIAVHPEFTNLLEKIAKKNFVDPAGCREYAAAGRRSLDARLAGE